MTVNKINKKHYNELKSSKEKIQHILYLQNMGLSIKEIAESMSYTKGSRVTDFMKTKGYTKIDGKFILEADKNQTTGAQDIKEKLRENITTNADKKQTKIRQEDPRDYADKMTTTNVQVFDNQEIQTKLLNIVNNYDDFIDGINWINEFKKQQEDNADSCQTIIEVNTGLQLDFPRSQTVKATIRVDEDIWDEFSVLCKDKYKHLNKQDIISKMVFEFIKQYK